ncbi:MULTISPECIES: hypothetical protein [Roseomonadaceae]|uniref:DUF202 domain-containing protein n=1 Tax=Falsiroseomonas oleicola TaxID=2801474 RepID=A0ABS6H5J3_9PROT|nr:hypothetical protein [Roseomonas oleicola]MBU8543950.1 hypothetical protein [Roseomonas oleicola]
MRNFPGDISSLSCLIFRMRETAIEMVQKLDAEVAAASRWAFGLLIGFLGTAATVAANGKEIVPSQALFNEKLPILSIFLLTTALYDYYVFAVRRQAMKLIEIGSGRPPRSKHWSDDAPSETEQNPILEFLKRKLSRDTWFRFGAFTTLMILAIFVIIEPFDSMPTKKFKIIAPAALPWRP